MACISVGHPLFYLDHPSCHPEEFDAALDEFRQLHLDQLLSQRALRGLARLAWKCRLPQEPEFAGASDRIRAIVPNASQRGVFVLEEGKINPPSSAL